MTRFIIVRHGKTDFNRLGRYQGQYNSTLEELGIKQAELAAKYIQENYHVDAVYSSDLTRTIDTAAPIASAFGLPINTTPAFREVDVGRWTLRYVKEIEESEPDVIRAYRENMGSFRFPDGESFEETRARAMKKIEEIANLHDGQTVVIVSHGGTIRTMITHFMGYSIGEMDKVPFLKNASISVVDYDGKNSNIIVSGDNSHLPEDMR